MYVPFRSCVHWETFFEKKKRQFSNTFVVESIGGCWSGIFFQFVYDLMQQILYLSDSLVLK